MSGGERMAASTGDHDRVKDALDGMSARDLERLRDLIEVRLLACILCGQDGASRYRVSRHGTRATLLLCPACFERHRLPDERTIEGDLDVADSEA